MTRAVRLLAIARDEWPALRWRVARRRRWGPPVTLVGTDSRGRRVVASWWPGAQAWQAVPRCSMDGREAWGRTLRVALRAQRRTHA